MMHAVWDYRNPTEWLERVRSSSLPPMIICCAITGGIAGKEVNPNLPETPQEQADQAYAAYRAGASMIHVHARNPERWYESARDAEPYRLVNRLIRERCPDVIINNTTGGGPGLSLAERLASLDAEPEVASLNMGPFMFRQRLKDRPPKFQHPRSEVELDGCMPVTYGEVTTIAQTMQEHAIKAEMEVYHPGMFGTVQHLIDEHLVSPPYLVQFVMGYQGGSLPTPPHLMALVNDLPAGALFGVIGLGPYQLPMLAMGILLGGHVRVGMEDNVYYRRGQLLADNAEAVARVVRIANELNREVATPDQARAMLGLSARPRLYT